MSRPTNGAGDELAAALTTALAAGTREAFVALLTGDVHWGRQHGGGECTSRGQAGPIGEHIDVESL